MMDRFNLFRVGLNQDDYKEMRFCAFSEENAKSVCPQNILETNSTTRIKYMTSDRT